jgi:hypothetical protein
VVACALVASAALAGLTAAGRPLAGAALAAGVILGSANPWLARKSLGIEASFRTASLGRLAVLTAAGLGVGSLFGLQNVPLTMVGLGVAQLLLAGLAAKSSLDLLRA